MGVLSGVARGAPAGPIGEFFLARRFFGWVSKFAFWGFAYCESRCFAGGWNRPRLLASA